MKDDFWECITFIHVKNTLCYQKDDIGTPKGEESSCNIGQATNVQLKQEADKK
jgi:hypothetical protein